jgi:hypothetical protein
VKRKHSLWIGSTTVLLFALLFSGSLMSSALAGSETFRLFLPSILSPCWPSSLPVGAISGQPLPVFCRSSTQGPDTSQEAENGWVDNFDHGLSFGDFEGTRYRIFDDVGFVHRTLHWRHANHWMVDIATRSKSTPSPWVRGGALLSPERSFAFENGMLVVEAEVAAGIKAYTTSIWPEIVISTGSNPDDVGSLYGYDLFPEDWTLGCRLQATRYPVCTLKNNSGSIAEGKGSRQIWEMSAHQEVGATNFGGSPFEGREEYWNVCDNTDPDDYCRDHFRLEITGTTLTLYVNGHKYFEQTGVPPLPAELTEGEVFVYLASMVVSHPADAVRFHWAGLAVNPEVSIVAVPGHGPEGLEPPVKINRSRSNWIE